VPGNLGRHRDCWWAFNATKDALGNTYGYQSAADKYAPQIHADLQDIRGIAEGQAGRDRRMSATPCQRRRQLEPEGQNPAPPPTDDEPEPTAETSPTPSTGYGTYIREFRSDNLHIVNGVIAGATRDIAYRRNDARGGGFVVGAFSAEGTPNASLNLGDADLGHITYDAWTNRPSAVAGGSVESFSGAVDHEPGADRSTGPASAISLSSLGKRVPVRLCGVPVR